MKKILIVHQSSELYGSDKTLLLFLKYLNKEQFYPVVILPTEGPLLTELQKLNLDVYVMPVIKLHRKMFVFKNLFLTVIQTVRSIKQLKKLDGKYKFDLVYSNTLAVLLGYLYARFSGKKHLWHVHEIIRSPKIVTSLFLLLLKSKANHFTIYNSFATANYWEDHFPLPKRENYSVVHNGVESDKLDQHSSLSKEIRKDFFDVNDEIVIGLVGRINKWKGQELLLNVFNSLLNKHNGIRLVFVGSPPPKLEVYLEDLKNKISALKREEFVKIIPFRDKIGEIWKAIDIAVVPSTEPEPFGLVAVEAMFAKKPVVASNHGGLTEIVENGESGFLVEPNNVEEFVEAIEKLILNKNLRIQMGERGHQRAEKMFSVKSYVDSIQEVLLRQI
ncbi:Glycosyl transferase, group 1 [Flavobacterium limnosediminis JC2902]|uniref:Glycosyl transferase, group 1 n=1 Tax=Flavobacterium limnosediminis JC2902 TaxID=1341181 RepID=V6SZZ4_9FLAO|nr:glycosyltransferase family 4 protein [Flavobacterium limnosediminis]ESU29995.1 Glycosyl transferase, group 1 [Flavobacterium limnosediminis JC2902]